MTYRLTQKVMPDQQNKQQLVVRHKKVMANCVARDHRFFK